MGAVRLAVIGAGLVGERHIELVRQASDCKLVAVVDPEPAIADVARRSGATHYVGHDEMLANERLDGAIVAVPTDLHVPVGAACARHGVHMLMEKPIAGDLRSARDLIDIVDPVCRRVPGLRCRSRSSPSPRSVASPAAAGHTRC